jgi:DNA repair exonuclease SbcCD ATPase subunit
VDELQAAQDRAEQQIAEHLERALQAEQKATEASEALASAEAEARDAQGRTAQFETELAAAAEKLKEMERTHNLETRVGELQERARTGEVHEGLTPVEARLVEVETALMGAEERAKEAEAKERTAQERVDAAAAELAATEASKQQLQEVYDVVRVQAEDLRLRQQVLEADLAAASAGAGAATAVVAEPSEAAAAAQAELERATARIQDLERQLEEAASHPLAGPVAEGDAAGSGDLAAVVAELEERLEQTEVRARRAYTAAEAAEAALRFAKESGEVVSSDPGLESEVQRNRFRSDLYFRLAVILLHLPPLRERGDDVLVLAEHFLRRFSAKYGKDVRRIDAPAREVLRTYPWPGNVRELSHVVERAVLWSRDTTLNVEHLSVAAPMRVAASWCSSSRMWP